MDFKQQEMKSKRRQFLMYLATSLIVVFLFALRLLPVRGLLPPLVQICLTKPKFEDYPVRIEDQYSKNPVSVNFVGSKLDGNYQTMIRKSMARGVNFAGQYVIVEWGCGVSCQNHALINAKTGKIVASGLESSYGAEFKKDSTLLIINPRADTWDGLKIKPTYYSIEDGKLVSVCD